MSRRSTPQQQIDEQAFPVRVRVLVPPGGMGLQYPQIHQWLVDRLGPANYALHGGGSCVLGDRISLHFRSTADALSFTAAFPALRLADATAASTYTVAGMPAGSEEDRARLEVDSVCNLFQNTRPADSIRQLLSGLKLEDRSGNMPPGPFYPDQLAPIVRHGADGLELVHARWGMPSPPAVLKTARDPGVTNVRNLPSPHWRRWLGPAHRCLVPVTSFAEPGGGGQNIWFAPADDGPAFFAGIELRRHRSVRKVKDGETEDDLFAFLTCHPNAMVQAVHPRAMPVILTAREEWECWLTAPLDIARKLQRPLPGNALKAVGGPI